MNILVTGGAGFIGSNFIKYLLEKYDYTIVNLDLLTYAGNLKNLKDIELNSNYHFVEGDICNRELVEEVFSRFDIQVVINFAAESHVDRSIENPKLFLETNILGTEVLLQVAKNYWAVGNKKYKTNAKFYQISTDEVYGTLGKEGFFTETTNLSPNSPYSATKASADMIARAYFETYGLPLLLSRCSNNYGPFQFPEKLIPMVIESAMKDREIPIYGNGKQIRDWLHVEDHCSAIDQILHSGRIGEVYNIGGNNEKENIEVVQQVLRELEKEDSLIEFVDDRLGHDLRYAIDNTKITNELGWKPRYTFEEGLALTIKWYLENNEWLEAIDTKKTVEDVEKWVKN
ncbi:dTDP-glucose 4,6-dehydratase [Sporosarcina siberiensis]|uniref:dTDP-glucose 4,6-dehydratase n=1 Tax=Sporosarcina siberiensis TaxID=1365606 RepID=A0ABW4SEY5_9BACL